MPPIHWSKAKTKGELKDARIADRAGNTHEVARILRRRGAAQVDSVKRVEGLEPELSIDTLGDSEILMQTEIDIGETGPAESIPALVAEGAERIGRKRGLTEVLSDDVVAATVPREIGAADQVPAVSTKSAAGVVTPLPTVKVFPLWSVVMPVKPQPLNIALANLLPNFTGISHNPEAVNTWV